MAQARPAMPPFPRAGVSWWEHRGWLEEPGGDDGCGTPAADSHPPRGCGSSVPWCSLKCPLGHPQQGHAPGPRAAKLPGKGFPVAVLQYHRPPAGWDGHGARGQLWGRGAAMAAIAERAPLSAAGLHSAHTAHAPPLTHTPHTPPRSLGRSHSAEARGGRGGGTTAAAPPYMGGLREAPPSPTRKCGGSTRRRGHVR